MTQATVSGVLPFSQHEAWALLSDLSRFDEWMTIHDTWCSAIPELAVGAKVTEQLTVMGIRNVVEWTVDSYAPPSSLRISGTGLAGAEIAFTLSVLPADAGSAVSIDAEFTGQMMAGPIGEAVERHATAELQNSLARLQELVS